MKLEPMLVHNYAKRLVTFPCYAQLKLNGVRAMWDGKQLISRDRKVFSPAVLPHIYEELRRLTSSEPCMRSIVESGGLDGELWLKDAPLQEINGNVSVMRKEAGPRSAEVCYYLFDIINERLPFAERFLREHCPLSTALRYPLNWVHPTYVSTQEHLSAYYTRAIQDGHEGIIIRVPPCPYRMGTRSYDVLRVKPWSYVWLPVVGKEPGKGKYSGVLGSLLLDYKGKPLAAGSGLSDEQRYSKSFAPVAVRVRFEMLSSKGLPLKPTLVDFCYDPIQAAEYLSMEISRDENFPAF